MGIKIAVHPRDREGQGDSAVTVAGTKVGLHESLYVDESLYVYEAEASIAYIR